MNKKEYQKPVMQVVKINAGHLLLQQSEVHSVGGNAGFNSEISGGNGSARSRVADDWDDEE